MLKFNKLVVVFFLCFILSPKVWALAANGLTNFYGFHISGNTLVTTDFIVSGTRGGIPHGMQQLNGVAFINDEGLGGGRSLSCVYRVQVDGTNTGSFELTDISANEFGTNDSFASTNVRVVGIKLADGSEIQSNSITGTRNVKDFYSSLNLTLTSFSGIQLTAIELRFDTPGEIGSETCGGMDFNSFTIANAQAPVTTKAEPSNHPTNFTATTNSTSQVTTAWTDASGAVTPDSYLVMCSTSNSFTDPVDGTEPNADSSCADGSGIQKIDQGTPTPTAWEGLNAGTQYFFKIFPFSNTGSDVDYKTDGSPLTATATTGASSGTTLGNASTADLSAQLGGTSGAACKIEYVLSETESTGSCSDFISDNPTVCNENDETWYPGSTSHSQTKVVLNSTKYSGGSYWSGSAKTSQSATAITASDLAGCYGVTASDIAITKSIGADPVGYDNQREIGIEFTVKSGAKAGDYQYTNVNWNQSQSVKAEPSNHPTNFTATTNSTSQITTTWTDATGTVTPDSYLVMCSTSNSFTDPSDGTAQSNDTSCADGSSVQNIAQGTQTVAWTGLNAGTQYFFKIFPYTNTGSEVNYNIAGEPTANATTTANINADATLTAAAGITEPVDLPTTANAAGNAVNLLDFTITDGGGGDGLSTDVTQIVINTAGSGDFSKVTWRLNGTNASNVVGTYNAGTNTITFSGLTLSIADGGSEIYTLSGFFNNNSGITDNSTYLFSVDGASDVTVAASGTQMATP